MGLHFPAQRRQHCLNKYGVTVIVIVNRKQQTEKVEQSGEDRIREKYDAEVYSMLTDEDIEAFLQ